MEDRSAVQCKLIGICCMKGEEQSMLTRFWNKRFTSHTAFLVDAGNNESKMQIAQKVCARVDECGFQSITDPLVMAVFLDLTDPTQLELLPALSGLGDMIRNALGAPIVYTQCFGFLGQLQLSDEETQSQLRQRAAAVLGNRSLHNLWLVAKPALAGAKRQELRWHSVIAMLDAYRRYPNPGEVLNLPEQGSVGYLRYGRFDEKYLLSQQKRKRELEQSLENADRAQFDTNLRVALERLEKQATERFKVNESLVPLHPDLQVTGWLKKGQAKKGTNKEYNRARQYTRDALLETGNAMQQQILALYQEAVQDPKAYLISMMGTSNVGLAFVRNRAILKDMLSAKSNGPRPDLPMLAYKEEGYDREILEYLQGMTRCAVATAKNWMLNALWQAYDQLDPMKMDEEEDRMKEELRQINATLLNLPSKEVFCSDALGMGTSLMAEFRPTKAGGNTKGFMLCYTPEMRKWIETQYEENYHVRQLYVNSSDPEGAPAEAFHLLYFNWTEPGRLDDLIK